MKVTKKQCDKKVQEAINKAKKNFKKLKAFAKRNKISDKELDKLCDIIDSYSILNCDLLDWSIKNGVDYSDMACGVLNGM